MKTKIFRTEESDNEQLASVCGELREKTGKIVSQSKFIDWAYRYCMKHKIYLREVELKKLSTGGDLRCK